jgi:type I restriction enzyme S subunit
MAIRKPVAEIVAESDDLRVSKHPSWNRVLLKEIAQIQNGFAFKSAYFNSSEGMPIIRIRDVKPNSTQTFYSSAGEYDEHYLVENGDLIVGMDGDFNSTIWQGGTALLNQRVCRIRVDDRKYNLKFLAYALPGYLDVIHKNTSSVTVKHLSSRSLEQIPLPLPTLPEQRRIVAEIEKQFTRLDTAVASLKRAQANLERYKASVLKAACEGRLVPQDADDEPAELLLQRILVERRKKWEEQAWQKQIEKAQKKVAQARRKADGRPHYIRDLEPQEWQEIHQ